MAAAHKAPLGSTWRPSEVVPRVWFLMRGTAEHIGSVGPVKGGKWMNRDTGEEFATKTEAQLSVEAWL